MFLMIRMQWASKCVLSRTIGDKSGCIWYSVQFSRSVTTDSLRPHELQHTRPLCPSPTSGVHPNSCPSSRWCLPAISSSVIPFSSCPQSLPASGSFPMSQLFAWGGQSISFSISPSNEHPGLIFSHITTHNILYSQQIQRVQTHLKIFEIPSTLLTSPSRLRKLSRPLRSSLGSMGPEPMIKVF